MAHRLLREGPKAFIAVAPASEGDSAKDGAARLAAESFADWLTEELGGADRWGDDGKGYREKCLLFIVDGFAREQGIREGGFSTGFKRRVFQLT